MLKKRSRQKIAGKMVVYCRVEQATITALDQICDKMRPKPSRAQLIDAALAEYVERQKRANGQNTQKVKH